MGKIKKDTKVISINIDNELLSATENFAESNDMSISAVIRKALKLLFLAENRDGVDKD